MSRRSLLRRATLGAAVVAVASFALSACATAGSETSSEVVWAIEGANLEAHMDPQVSQLDVTAMVQRQVFDSLVFQNADGTFSPWLAEKWEISADGRVYTFTLRQDVKFTDGEPFNAEAVKANFTRIMDPATESAQAASMLGGENYVSTDVIDEFTVSVTFAEPYAPFLGAASQTQLGFYSPKVIAEQGDKIKQAGPGITVGTGPFIMTEYTPKQSIVYTANPDYKWGPNGGGAPKLETLRVDIVPESATRIGMINEGEAQIASDFTPDNASQLSADLTIDTTEYPGLPYSLFLNEKYGVFADQKVREAFARSLDIDTAVNAVYDGNYERAWSILGPTTPSYDSSLEGSWPYDTAVADSLLDEAGWTARDADGYRVKDGKRLSVRWIAWTPVPDDAAALANAIQADAKAVGIEVVRDVLEPGAYNEQYGPKTFDITDWGFSGTDPDLLRSHLATDGFQNASQVSDPKIDALLSEGASATDQAVRDDAYKQLQAWNAQHYAIVPIYVPGTMTAVSASVEGLTYDLYGRPLFAGVSVK